MNLRAKLFPILKVAGRRVELLFVLIGFVSVAGGTMVLSATATTFDWKGLQPQQTATPAPTPTPVRTSGLPVVSPDGSYIAFMRDEGGTHDLFVISKGGTGELQLTHTAENESISGWSANGKEIIFSVFANETSRVFSIAREGGNPREIGRVPGRAPMISPDAKHFVFMAGTWTATRLMVSALDGSDARQINDGASIAWNNHWSPNGKLIAFTGRKEPKGELAVFVMKADGSDLRQISHIPPDEGGAQWPVWLPNGRQLAVQVNSRTIKGLAHIWTIDVATGEARKLGDRDKPYLDETPSWYPNGKQIAFQSNRTGTMEVWVMNADGSGQRQVTGLQRDR